MERLDIGNINFAFDLDDFTLEFTRPFFQFCNDMLGKDITYEEIFSQNYWEVLNISRKEVISLVHRFQETELFYNLNFTDGAKENIPLLSKVYGKLPIITSRDIKFKQGTKDHLKRILPSFISDVYHSDYHFESNGRCKSRICKEIGINVFGDDSIYHAKSCADQGIQVLLFDRPWNHGFSYQNVSRVFSWDEICDILLNNNRDYER